MPVLRRAETGRHLTVVRQLSRSGRVGEQTLSRGRGDASLNSSGNSDEKNTKFKQVVLPPGFLVEPKDEVIGITPTAPTDELATSAPRNSRRLSDPASGKETWNRKLRPRHRSVVRKYFDSK